MKQKSAVTLGPGIPSLILIFVVLTLSLLSMLALQTGRNDALLSERSLQIAEDVYELNSRAEESLAALDAVLAAGTGQADDDTGYLNYIRDHLPEGMEQEGTAVCWTETDGTRNLHCMVEILPLGSSTRMQWKQHVLVSAASEDEPEELFGW